MVTHSWMYEWFAYINGILVCTYDSTPSVLAILLLLLTTLHILIQPPLYARELIRLPAGTCAEETLDNRQPQRYSRKKQNIKTSPQKLLSSLLLQLVWPSSSRYENKKVLTRFKTENSNPKDFIEDLKSTFEVVGSDREWSKYRSQSLENISMNFAVFSFLFFADQQVLLSDSGHGHTKGLI